MSYVPSHQSALSLAKPNALTIIQHTESTTQTITVGNKVQIGTIHNWFGSFSPSISSDAITLPSGYWYYMETGIQTYVIGSFTSSIDTSFQHYNETSSSYVGTKATNFGVYGYSADLELFTRDASARALIDCTSSSVEISIKITANDGYNRINYNSGHYVNAGIGRSIIWQLNS